MVGSLRICVDTNVLVRAVVSAGDAAGEEGRQSQQAASLLRGAEQVVVSSIVLCEFVWVLRSVYKYSFAEIAVAIRALAAATNVVCDRRAVAAGLTIGLAGGDFADGVIAEAGFVAGADIFVSFDQRAVKLIMASGRHAMVPQ